MLVKRLILVAILCAGFCEPALAWNKHSQQTQGNNTGYHRQLEQKEDRRQWEEHQQGQHAQEERARQEQGQRRQQEQNNQNSRW